MKFAMRGKRCIGYCECGREHDMTELLKGTALIVLDEYRNLQSSSHGPGSVPVACSAPSKEHMEAEGSSPARSAPGVVQPRKEDSRHTCPLCGKEVGTAGLCISCYADRHS